MEHRHGRILTLTDGRSLGFADYGDPNGVPVFEFHGNPSSRLGAAFFDEAGARIGVRVIGIDRPGMGLSDHKPNRTLLDWPDDVLELASALEIERFAVLGGSGGVPSALACACKIPERLTAVSVLFGPAPPGTPAARSCWTIAQRLKAALARYGPVWIGAMALKPFAKELDNDPDRALGRLFKGLPASDIAALEAPQVRERYLDAIREAFRSGAEGAALDFALNMRPWGFPLEAISMEIDLWHGEEDTVTPPAMGRGLAETLPNCQARFIPGEGHFSLLPNHAGEILAALAARQSAAPD